MSETNPDMPDIKGMRLQMIDLVYVIHANLSEHVIDAIYDYDRKNEKAVFSEEIKGLANEAYNALASLYNAMMETEGSQ
jgi:hypothetical protein